MTPITNINQLNQLMSDTTIYAIVVALVATVLAVAVAFMFPWQSNPDRSYVKRRIAYIIIGIIAVLGFWLYNNLEVVDYIKNAGFQNMFKKHNFLCLFINLGVYLVVTVIMMFVFRRSKFGSILPKRFKK